MTSHGCSVKETESGALICSIHGSPDVTLDADSVLDEITLPNQMLLVLSDRVEYSNDPLPEMIISAPIVRMTPINANSQGDIQFALIVLEGEDMRFPRERVITHLRRTRYNIPAMVRGSKPETPRPPCGSGCGSQ